jgi:hypothetical protein
MKPEQLQNLSLSDLEKLLLHQKKILDFTSSERTTSFAGGLQKST